MLGYDKAIALVQCCLSRRPRWHNTLPFAQWMTFFPGGTMSFHQSEEMQKGIICIWITHMWGDSTAEGFPNPRFIHGSNQCQKCSQGLLKCPIPFISHENPLDISRTRVLSFHSCRNSCENLLHHLRSINKAVWLSPDSF